MAKRAKKMQEALKKIDNTKTYDLVEAIALAKKNKHCKI